VGTEDSEAAASALRRRENVELQLASVASAAAGPAAVCRGVGAASGELEGGTCNDVVRRLASKLAMPSPTPPAAAAVAAATASAGAGAVVRMGPPSAPPAPDSSRTGGAVMAVVGPALGALPPAPPKAGRRGAE
jgi:hypothetical protein